MREGDEPAARSSVHAALRTVTALLRRIRFVRAAAAARITVGRRIVEITAVVLTDLERVKPNLVSQLDLVEHVAHALDKAHRRAAAQVGRRGDEVVDSELHHGPVVLAVVS